MTAPAPTDARAEARERFYRAALWHAADLQCSNALAEFEDAYEALSAFGRIAVREMLSQPASHNPVSSDTPTAEGERKVLSRQNVSLSKIQGRSANAAATDIEHPAPSEIEGGRP